MVSIALNLELVAIILMGIFLLYLVGIVLANTYMNLTAKDVGFLFVVVYMLGILTVSYIVGSATFIIFSFIVAIIFVVLTFVRIAKKNKSNKAQKAAQQGGNQT